MLYGCVVMVRIVGYCESNKIKDYGITKYRKPLTWRTLIVGSFGLLIYISINYIRKTLFTGTNVTRGSQKAYIRIFTCI